ncbi:MAG: ABC transporter ATP-binding protein [Thiothrix sp.]|nr:ABC transporter ATP-binding protein [Thiothrix sp.]HPQ96313.1 ABC transporter ATP-binding protein [Thiolinea sp.]
MNVIELRELRFRWPGQARAVLAIPQLTLQAGEHVFLRGPSGSGKTTLLNLLAGILKPQQGELHLLGQPAHRLRAAARDRLRADHMGVIFQQFNLLPYLSLLDNVLLPCHFSARRRQQAGNVQASARHLLAHLQLEPALLQRSVTELSVGQQQRVAVARALIGRPELVIADEPTSALDADSRDRFLELLFHEADAQHSTILFVSHDARIARHFPRVLELNEVNQA